MKGKLSIAAVVLALAALTAAGCGGDDSGGSTGSTGPANETQASTTTDTTTTDTGTTETGASGGGKATTLQLSADPGGALKFDKSTLEAKAGPVEIVMDNPSTLPHAIEIEGQGEAGETVTQGGKSTTKADLKPGEYRYYCPVAGHAEAGMEGTLTVK